MRTSNDHRRTIDGSITSQVYGCIRDGEFTKAIEILDAHLGDQPKSRPILSLLAYCCYNNQDYARAAEFYEELVAVCPEEESYRVFYAQALVMAGAYHDASRVAADALSRSKSADYYHRLSLLQAQSQLELGMFTACKKTLSHCKEENAETIIALATVDYREEKFATALEKYKIARQVMGDAPMLMYHIALCSHRMGDNEAALDEVKDIINLAGADDNPDKTDESVMKESFLVEALNLKAVICIEMNQRETAKDAMSRLSDIASDVSLDAISMHNEIMSNIEEDHFVGMQRLSRLLSNSTFPPETLANLLLLYIKHGQYVLAAEIFEANRPVARELLSPELFTYLEAAILSLSCPEDAFEMLDNLVADTTPRLKAARKRLGEAETASSKASTARPSTTSIRPTTTARILSTSLSEAKQELNTLLKTFIPILMLQAKLFWDRKEYTKAEQLLLKHLDYCSNDDDWNLNMGHILFAQQRDKFEESIQYYERVINKWAESGELLMAPAVALANLCVSYIMTGQNELAEAIMKTVENEEQQQLVLEMDDGTKPTYHTCLVNLVIGTLYCEKGNFEFGISRICKSLEPLEKNLCPDTWFYTKRCLLALAGKVSKLMCVMEDEMFQDVVSFLNEVERHGKTVKLTDDEESQSNDAFGFSQGSEHVTVAFEARQLKHLFQMVVV